MKNPPLFELVWYTGVEAAEIEQRERMPSEWQRRTIVEKREANLAADYDLLNKAYRECDANRLRTLNMVQLLENANQQLHADIARQHRAIDALNAAVLKLTSSKDTDAHSKEKGRE